MQCLLSAPVPARAYVKQQLILDPWPTCQFGKLPACLSAMPRTARIEHICAVTCQRLSLVIRV